MGNRAVIGFISKDGVKDKNTVGIYLHWNGGRDSVEGFLATAKQYGVRTNEDYGVARLIQIIANTLGGTLSLGVDQIKKLDCDNYDNGLYKEARDFWSYFIGTLPSSNKITISNRAYANDIYCGMLNNKLNTRILRRVA